MADGSPSISAEGIPNPLRDDAPEEASPPAAAPEVVLDPIAAHRATVESAVEGVSFVCGQFLVAPLAPEESEALTNALLPIVVKRDLPTFRYADEMRLAWVGARIIVPRIQAKRELARQEAEAAAKADEATAPTEAPRDNGGHRQEGVRQINPLAGVTIPVPARAG